MTMSDIAEPTLAAERPHGVLRRELRVWEAFAISVGIMAPTAAMALNGVLPASIVGRAVPLAFLLASVAIALVSYAFIRLTSYFMADAINLGAMLSAFASGLGCAVGAARLLFAMGRDGFVTTRLGDTSRRTGAPIVSLACVMAFAVIVGVALRINGTTSVNVFFYMGTIGVLSMLVAYIVVNLGAMRFLHLGRREALWRVTVPILAIAALVYVIYKNVWPRPAYPYDNFPLMVGGWLLLGIASRCSIPAWRAGSGSACRRRRASRRPTRRRLRVTTRSRA
jgi:amino acid transporter